MSDIHDRDSFLRSKMVTQLRTEKGDIAIITEVDLLKKPLVTTYVKRAGKVLSTRKHEINEVFDLPHVAIRAQEIASRHHLSGVMALSSGRVPEEKTPAEYLDQLKRILRKKNLKGALVFLDEALSYFPDDPFILSYHGCLEAIVNGRHGYGIKVCQRALKEMRDRMPFGEEFFYPVLYLNLGRAYLAAGKKKEALASFKKGRSFDKENADLQWEIKKLGLRKKPPITLLKRSHPLNKYIGKLLHKLNG